MRLSVSMRILGAAGFGLALAGATGCPSGTTTITGSNTIRTLTTTESNAMQAALNGMGAVAGASSAVQGVSAGDVLDSGQSDPSDNAITFGQCPVISISVESAAARSLNLNIDFGDGCTPTGSNISCAGSAAGTVDQATQQLSATFSGFACDGHELGGTVDLAWTRGTGAVSLDGDWSLDYEDGSRHVSTSGAGLVSFDSSSLSTTITTFDGTIEDGTGTWTAEASALVTSYASNGNVVPSSGQITLSGTDIHTFTVYFSSASPSTGVVQVSVNGGPSFEVNLNDL